MHLTALFGFGSMGHYLLHLVAFTLVALPVSLRGNKVMEVSKAKRNAGHITFLKESHHMPCSGSLWKAMSILFDLMFFT